LLAGPLQRRLCSLRQVCAMMFVMLMTRHTGQFRAARGQGQGRLGESPQFGLFAGAAIKIVAKREKTHANQRA
jgi:hypothetical protein